jgi:hypothetical protein
MGYDTKTWISDLQKFDDDVFSAIDAGLNTPFHPKLHAIFSFLSICQL